MKRILIFLALSLAAYVSFSQSPIYGRLRVISGTYDNYFQNGTDTFKLGWRTDRFQLKYNANKRFMDFVKADSSTMIYNKLILSSPNDTMLSVRGNQFLSGCLTFGDGSQQCTAFISDTGYVKTTGDTIYGDYYFGSTDGYLNDNELYLFNDNGEIDLVINDTYGGLLTLGGIGDEVSELYPTKLKIKFGDYSIVYDNNISIYNSDYYIRKFDAISGNVNGRFIKFTDSDSSTTIYNKLILESPNDTMLSVRGGGMNVTDGSVLFSGTTGTTPASGEGTRLMWIPSKAAFRAGYVDDVHWDDANIGQYSVALGYNSKASGEGAFAIGDGANATGMYSYAFGAYNTASGNHSIANGNFSTASGENSYSNGYNILASGDYSFASGAQTVANSCYLSVFGQFNDTTISTSEIAWVSTDPLFQIGNGTEESKRNDAFRILKNGKTYIGDSSSTTDAILVVDPTDSTSAFIGNVSITDTATMGHLTVTDSITLEDALFDIYHLAPDADSLVVADDGVINLRAGAYGELHVSVYNAGMYEEFAWAIINTDGSIGILIQSSTDVTTTGGTDGNLNIYDGGAYTTIENKLGGSRTIKYVFTH